MPLPPNNELIDEDANPHRLLQEADPYANYAWSDGCKEWYSQYSYKYYLAYVPSLIISIINTVLVIPILMLCVRVFGHLSMD